MCRVAISIVLLFLLFRGYAQPVIRRFSFAPDITITIDAPKHLQPRNQLWLIWYALPNGSTTAQTMGKKMKPGDDPRFGLQHIAAQTAFIRQLVKRIDIVVVYAENSFKSWPTWKAQHAPDYVNLIHRLVDTVSTLFPHAKQEVQLNGHSGGGRFIFSYLDGVTKIPPHVARISFLDSNYGYDSSYLPKFITWLKGNNSHHLAVFAYNDSVALYEGKPFVSSTGGTWYRSKMMLRDLADSFALKDASNDSMLHYFTADRRLQFYLKTNPRREIFHTVQVERNGFIHAALGGTKYDSRKYRYYGKRAYDRFIR